MPELPWIRGVPGGALIALCHGGLRSSGMAFRGALEALLWGILAGVPCLATPARAAVVLIPDIADEDPIEAIRTRADLLKIVGGMPGVVIAPLSKFKRLAQAAHLDPANLGSAEAAIGLGRTTPLTGILGGSVEEVYGRRVLRLRAFDRAGNLICRSSLDLGEGTLGLEDRQLLADRLMTALGLSETARGPSRVVVARAEEATPGEPVEDADASPRAAPAEPVSNSPTARRCAVPPATVLSNALSLEKHF